MPKKKKKTNNYDASAIQVLEGLEAVRVRPGMYVGGTGKLGMHHLIWEILDNSVDEVGAGHADEIVIEVQGNTVSIEDNGRGIPCEKHPKLGIPTLDVVFTKLHAGGKFDVEGGAYKTAGGLHGVGSAVANALSDAMHVTVWRGGKEYNRKYACGNIVGKFSTKKCKRSRTGTKVVFSPDPKIFGKQKLDPSMIRERVKTKAYLNAGLKIKLKIGELEETFMYNNGLLDHLTDFLDEGDDVLVCKPIHIKEKNVEIALVWTESTVDTVISYANGIFTRDGGSHVKAADKAIVDSVREMAKEIWPKRMKESPKDIREGVVLIVSVYLTNPQFQGQTKDRLNNLEHSNEWFDTIYDSLLQKLNNPSLLKSIARRIESSYRARIASRQAADAVKRSTPTSRLRLPGKLADCSVEDRDLTELFIVEGDSAGGSAKQGRDRKTQAILPLRGKVLNAESATLSKVLNNAELKDLITAIGTGVLESFNIDKLRYGKIIIMTDADTDGHHIATLLLTFFYRYMPELLREGKVFLAQPPLYKVVNNAKTHWAISEEHKDELLRKIKSKDVEITRFKGLGEMPPRVLFQTTMDPDTRDLLQVTIDDIDECEFWVSSLMGKDPEIRAELISMYVTDYVDVAV